MLNLSQPSRSLLLSLTFADCKYLKKTVEPYPCYPKTKTNEYTRPPFYFTRLKRLIHNAQRLLARYNKTASNAPDSQASFSNSPFLLQIPTTFLAHLKYSLYEKRQHTLRYTIFINYHSLTNFLSNHSLNCFSL